jgi:hypothetical protein
MLLGLTAHIAGIKHENLVERPMAGMQSARRSEKALREPVRSGNSRSEEAGGIPMTESLAFESCVTFSKSGADGHSLLSLTRIFRHKHRFFSLLLEHQ